MKTIQWFCGDVSIKSLNRCFTAMQDIQLKNDNFIEIIIATWMLNEKGILKLPELILRERNK